jgi:hypothetical protein
VSAGSFCCVTCEDDDCVAALYSTGGRFCCESCVADPVNENFKAGGSRAACCTGSGCCSAAAGPAAGPAGPELRRSSREATPVVLLEPKWSAFEMDRQERGMPARATTATISCKLRERSCASPSRQLRSRIAGLASNLEDVYRRLRELAALGAPGHAGLQAYCKVAAAVLLREAIAELTQDWDRRQEEEAREGAPRKESDAEAHAASETEAAEPHWVASPVRVGGVDGTMGQLSINAYVHFIFNISLQIASMWPIGAKKIAPAARKRRLRRLAQYLVEFAEYNT